MYKVICPIDNEIKWQTKDRKEAISKAKKNNATVYSNNLLIKDFSGKEET